MNKERNIGDFLKDNTKKIKNKALLILPVLHEAFAKNGSQGVTDYCHSYIDAINDTTGLTAKTSCAPGCHFCCYGEIKLSYTEATVIYSAIKQFMIPVDKQLVERQNRKPYHRLKYMNKRCAMLDDKGKCKIYLFRPSVCRLYNSTDDPKECNEQHKVPDTETLRTIEGLAVMVALMEFDKDQGNNKKYMLQKVLSKL